MTVTLEIAPPIDQVRNSEHYEHLGLSLSEMAIGAEHALNHHLQPALVAAEGIVQDPAEAQQLVASAIAKLDVLRDQTLILASAPSILRAAANSKTLVAHREEALATLEGDATGGFVPQHTPTTADKGHIAQLVAIEHMELVETIKHPVRLTSQEGRVVLAGIAVAIEEAETTQDDATRKLLLHTIPFIAARIKRGETSEMQGDQ